MVRHLFYYGAAATRQGASPKQEARSCQPHYFFQEIIMSDFVKIDFDECFVEIDFDECKEDWDTEDAHLMVIDDERIWIPRSQTDHVCRKTKKIYITEWFAKIKGLI